MKASRTKALSNEALSNYFFGKSPEPTKVLKPHGKEHSKKRKEELRQLFATNYQWLPGPTVEFNADQKA